MIVLRRFYSHYTFVFPYAYLKNVIVELDELHHLKRIFPFQKEIESTEFYSGWLFFIPESSNNINHIVGINKDKCINIDQELYFNNNIRYIIRDEEENLIDR